MKKPTTVVNRGSPWGNPFVLGHDGNHSEVIAKYEQHLLEEPALMTRLGELKGKRLGCFCAPLACHGDVLARHAETKS